MPYRNKPCSLDDLWSRPRPNNRLFGVVYHPRILYRSKWDSPWGGIGNILWSQSGLGLGLGSGLSAFSAAVVGRGDLFLRVVSWSIANDWNSFELRKRGIRLLNSRKIGGDLSFKDFIAGPGNVDIFTCSLCTALRINLPQRLQLLRLGLKVEYELAGSSIPIIFLDVVGHCLWFVVCVVIVFDGADVLHFVN